MSCFCHDISLKSVRPCVLTTVDATTTRTQGFGSTSSAISELQHTHQRTQSAGKRHPIPVLLVQHSYSLKKIMALPIFRCIGQKATFFRSRAAVSSLATRAFGSSHVSLVGAHIVHKNTAPPKASMPPPVKEEPLKNTNETKRTTWKRPKKTKTPPPPARTENLSGLPSSGWVIIRNIPPMSTLTDIVNSVNEFMDALAGGGIVDLDAAWKGGGQVNMLQLDSSQEWLRSAHIVLSSHGRPTAWRVEFFNRSMANAFLEYSREHRFHCAWKPVDVEPWDYQEGNTDAIDISDSMVRVENAADDVTVDHVRHLFRRYDMTPVGPSVRLFNEASQHKLFLVHFADPSWARAAVRELQGVRVRQNLLRLAQYPKQLVALDNC